MEKLKSFLNLITSKKVSQILLNFLIIIAIIFFLMNTENLWRTLFNLFWLIIKPFLYAFILAFVLNTLVVAVAKYIPSKSFSVIIVYIGIFALLVLMVVLAVPLFFNSLANMVPTITYGLNEIASIFKNNFKIDITNSTYQIREAIINFINSNNLLNNTWLVVNEIIGQFTNFIIYITLAIYMSFTYDNIKILIKKFVSKFNVNAPSILTQLNYSLSLFVRAFIITAIVQGITSALMYLAIGHSSWGLMGLLSAISSFIPYVGPIIVNALGIVTSFSLGIPSVIILIVLVFIQSILMGYVITPKIYSSQVGLGVMPVLFAILTGSTLFGISGIIIAMPIAVIIKLFYQILSKKDDDKVEA